VILALELGGNNPLVVWDAGDAEAVAALVVQSAFITTGQRCSCARRLIVSDDAAGRAVIDAVAALSERLVIGPWNGREEAFMGPLISDRAAAHGLGRRPGHARQGRARHGGGRRPEPGVRLAGLGRRDRRGRAGRGTVRAAAAGAPGGLVRRGDRRRQRHALRLSAGLISNETAHWEHFLKRIRAGVVNWNRPTTGAAGTMPFGGLGSSGNHRPSAYYAADYCAYPVASFEARA
jgi:succinylglutamic semialdehyde dehydrogenase